MRTSKFTPGADGDGLRQAEAGTPIEDVCRKLGISEATFHRWKKRLGSLGISEIRELRQLRDENRRLKSVVADLTVDKVVLQDALRKKW
jgi:putative transposase